MHIWEAANLEILSYVYRYTIATKVYIDALHLFAILMHNFRCEYSQRRNNTSVWTYISRRAAIFWFGCHAIIQSRSLVYMVGFVYHYLFWLKRWSLVQWWILGGMGRPPPPPPKKRLSKKGGKEEKRKRKERKKGKLNKQNTYVGLISNHPWKTVKKVSNFFFALTREYFIVPHHKSNSPPMNFLDPPLVWFQLYIYWEIFLSQYLF